MNNFSIFHKKNINHRIYKKYVSYILNKYQSKIINSGKSLTERGIFYLPPSINNNKNDQKLIKKIQEKNEKLYFRGWLFRNPAGIQKYRTEIIKYFEPKYCIRKKVIDFIDKLKKKYQYLVGVHIRQGDYKNGNFRKYYFSPRQAYEILIDFKEKSGIKNICFVICSDEKVDLTIFKNINIIAGPGDFIKDLFILASTNFIIGSNSTFGSFASYYGNIPIVIFKRGNINWNYYFNKKGYFENKECTMVQY